MYFLVQFNKISPSLQEFSRQIGHAVRVIKCAVNNTMGSTQALYNGDVITAKNILYNAAEEKHFIDMVMN